MRHKKKARQYISIALFLALAVNGGATNCTQEKAEAEAEECSRYCINIKPKQATLKNDQCLLTDADENKTIRGKSYNLFKVLTCICKFYKDSE